MRGLWLIDLSFFPICPPSQKFSSTGNINTKMTPFFVCPRLIPCVFWTFLWIYKHSSLKIRVSKQSGLKKQPILDRDAWLSINEIRWTKQFFVWADWDCNIGNQGNQACLQAQSSLLGNQAWATKFRCLKFLCLIFPFCCKSCTDMLGKDSHCSPMCVFQLRGLSQRSPLLIWPPPHVWPPGGTMTPRGECLVWGEFFPLKMATISTE